MTHQLQFCYSKHEKKIKSPVKTGLSVVYFFRFPPRGGIEGGGFLIDYSLCRPPY